MNTLFNPQNLVRRADRSALDNMQINVGDVVHLQVADGPAIRAKVIYNAPYNGTTTYTTDLVCAGNGAGARPARIRFRHEHVHRIESVRHQPHA